MLRDESRGRYQGGLDKPRGKQDQGMKGKTKQETRSRDIKQPGYAGRERQRKSVKDGEKAGSGRGGEAGTLVGKEGREKQEKREKRQGKVNEGTEDKDR